MQTIAIINEKGGTAKTTTAVNLAASLGDAGKRVLLVDLDGQAATSRWLGVEEDSRLAEALVRGSGLVPISQVIPGVDLAPASGKIDSVAHELRPTQGGQLRKVLAEIADGCEYDYVLMDCPPSLGNRLIGNALLAATDALVPVETSILALDGLRILLTMLSDIRDGFGYEINLMGVLACRFDARTRLSRLVLSELRRALPGKVFSTVIRENVKLQECPAGQQTILKYAPASSGAEDYRALAAELIAGPVLSTDSDAVETAAAETADLARNPKLDRADRRTVFDFRRRAAEHLGMEVEDLVEPASAEPARAEDLDEAPQDGPQDDPQDGLDALNAPQARDEPDIESEAVLRESPAPAAPEVCRSAAAEAPEDGTPKSCEDATEYEDDVSAAPAQTQRQRPRTLKIAVAAASALAVVVATAVWFSAVRGGPRQARAVAPLPNPAADVPGVRADSPPDAQGEQSVSGEFSGDGATAGLLPDPVGAEDPLASEVSRALEGVVLASLVESQPAGGENASDDVGLDAADPAARQDDADRSDDAEVTASAVRAEEPPAAAPRGLELSSILSGGTGGGSAILNGRFVRPGEAVNGATLVDVRTNGVVLEYRGSRYLLNIGEDPIPLAR